MTKIQPFFSTCKESLGRGVLSMYWVFAVRKPKLYIHSFKNAHMMVKLQWLF